MKNLAIVAATSILALCLTACGEHKKEETTAPAAEAAQPMEQKAEPMEQKAESAEPAEQKAE